MTLTWNRCTDGELLRATSEDPEAFAAFYRRYEAVVARQLLMALGDPEASADLTAETFAQALLKADHFRDPHGAPALGWLLGIARHLMLQYLRRGRIADRARRKLELERVDWNEDSLVRLASLADETVFGQVLDQALAELPRSQREAVLEYVVHDHSYSELAHRHAISEPNARQRVSRGLARLRTAIDSREAS